jgi:limonene-1,2-epoxide hydrolase
MWWREMPVTNESARVVREFCDLMVKRDAEALRPYLADDAIYQNVGMTAQVGPDTIVADLANQFAMFETYEYQVKNLVADGDVVLTERVDYIGTKDDPKGLPVMGAFVVHDGKITRWHDYWDSGLVGKLMTGEDVSALVPTKY